MRRTLKALLCIILITAVLTSLTSCDILTDLGIKVDDSDNPARMPGYTGGGLITIGDPHFKNHKEMHWVETYEEALAVIEGLKNAGNNLPQFYLPNYDNEAVDAKYAFLLDNYQTKRADEGQEWYDRKFHLVENIFYFGFLEKVSIETLEFGYYYHYKCIETNVIFQDIDYVSTYDLTYECGFNNGYEYCAVKSGKTNVARLYFNNMAVHDLELPETFHEDFIKSLVYIGD